MNVVIWLTTLIVSAIAGYLGTLMISKRMSLVAGPLAHLALPGVALALMFNFNTFIGALGFILFGALIVWALKRVSNLPFEALTGIAFAFGLSLGFLLLPMQHAEEAIMGDVTKITLEDLWIASLFSSIVLFTISKSYKKMILITLSEDLAKSMKINIKLYDLIFLISIALVVAMEVKIVGGIVTVAMIIIPASIASNISRNMREYVAIAPLSGVASSVVGLLLYEKTMLPAGPLIILSAFSLFLISLLFKRN